MIAAALILFAAFVALVTPGVVRILREQDAKCQALIDDALEPQVDWEAAEQWWASQGRSQLR